MCACAVYVFFTALHSNWFTQILTQNLTQVHPIMTQKTLTLTWLESSQGFSSWVKWLTRVKSKKSILSHDLTRVKSSRFGLSQVQSSWFEWTQVHKYKISQKPVLYGAKLVRNQYFMVQGDVTWAADIIWSYSGLTVPGSLALYLEVLVSCRSW